MVNVPFLFNVPVFLRTLLCSIKGISIMDTLLVIYVGFDVVPNKSKFIINIIIIIIIAATSKHKLCSGWFFFFFVVGFIFLVRILSRNQRTQRTINTELFLVYEAFLNCAVFSNEFHSSFAKDFAWFFDILLSVPMTMGIVCKWQKKFTNSTSK